MTCLNSFACHLAQLHSRPRAALPLDFGAVSKQIEIWSMTCRAIGCRSPERHSNERMLNVYFTIDVEIWCDGWSEIDRKFPDAFRRYIYGASGSHGLPDQLRMLGDHGLKSVCFVEALFAGRFGLEPLAEVVGLIEGAGHEAQLHLHTEWVDEARQPMLPGTKGKRQHLRYFDVDEQSQLLQIGIDWLQQAGAPRPVGFRAGSFAFNKDTLTALERNGIFIDSSYNASTLGPGSGVCQGELLTRSRRIGAVLELPMTVYADGRGLRHVQLTACSWSEIEHLLWQALETEQSDFVILSHSFELLTPGQKAVDPVVHRRLQRLCTFLDRHRDSFCVRGLRDGLAEPAAVIAGQEPPASLHSPLWRTGLRMAEQAWRRSYA